MSWLPDPGALVINAFLCEWDYDGIYCFPPFILLSRVLRKIEQEKATVTLIAPLWPNQVWFPKMLKMIVEHPLLIENKKGLLTQTGEGFPHQNLKLIVCKLSGNTSKIREYQNDLGRLLLNPGDQRRKNLIQPTLESGFYFVNKGNLMI